MSKLEPSYQNALKLLNSRRRTQRPNINATNVSDQSQPPKVDGQATLRGKPSYLGMRSWLNQIGHTDDTIDGLRIIHIAGTKGKGSTCAFTEAFLGAHRQRTGFPKTYGLYTSPSLYEETERIRLNSQQLSKQKFTENLFEIWSKLDPENRSGDSLPRYLQLVLLTAIHTFIKENVDVAIIETHSGGQYDSTNIFKKPLATGIASLGLDHVAQLGPTIADIAWHKAGILKQRRPAFALASQPEAALKVLKDRSEELETTLKFIEDDTELPLEHQTIRPSVQRSNCSLAKALVSSYLEQEAPTMTWSDRLTNVDIRNALDIVSLPGRFQQILRGSTVWYFDGAHNAMSIGHPVSWFAESIRKSADAGSEEPLMSVEPHKSKESSNSSSNILVYSHISIERDGEEVLVALIEAVIKHKLVFDHVIFCYDGIREDGSLKQDMNFGTANTGDSYAQIWRTSLPDSDNISITSTILDTMSLIQDSFNTKNNNNNNNNNVSAGRERRQINILVTGSFHLVGGLLAQVTTDSESSSNSNINGNRDDGDN